ncbi:MAG TPA: ATP-binding protein [Prolixibacteraceae bacterium]|nr:ATP-binding protein [Prolixibacteraceae bacterium]
MEKNKRITIINNIDQLPTLAEQIEQIADEWELDPMLAMNMNLVIEEAITNVIFYAFNDQENHQIDIDFNLNDSILKLVITDDGTPFDPTQKGDPDTTLSVEDRQIGGLGIFLIRKIMNEVKYKRKNNKNILTLTKSI